MTLDEKLIADVDRAVRRLRTTRSAFTREALQEALRRLRDQELERRQREGYRRKPVRRGEFDVWQGEQAWPK
jgi:metal-responsive CopG/Arc/MetJ family transcriptional regulator